MDRLCLAWVAAALVACGSQAEPSSSVSEHREAVRNGTLGSDPAIVALVDRRRGCDGPPPEVRCTGSLVAEHWVLTAAHCVRGAARGELEVFFGTTPGEPGGKYRGIAASIVHPRYERQLDDHDLALLRLDQPGPAPPLRFVDRALTDSWLGQTARVVGFGTTGDPNAASAMRRQGAVLLTELGDFTLSYGPGPSMTCPGDSGGPVLFEADGTEVIIGVTTSGDRECEELGVGARIDAQLASFIEPILAEPPRELRTVEPDMICSASCRTDRDCPADLACRADVDGVNRCLLPGAPVADLLAACDSDADCGSGSCVPLNDECRCSEPCATDEPAGRPGSSRGCQLAVGSSSLSSMLFGLFACLGLCYRRLRA